MDSLPAKRGNGAGGAREGGIRPVEWADGANHEGLATLLLADGDTVGHTAAQNLRHGIGVLGGASTSDRRLFAPLFPAITLAIAGAIHRGALLSTNSLPRHDHRSNRQAEQGLQTKYGLRYHCFYCTFLIFS